MTQGEEQPRHPGDQDNDSARTWAEIAAKLKADADDPDEVRKALDAAAGMSRNLWLALLTFGTYLVIAVSSVTHRDLFLQTPIKLPLLNVELPLVAFFVVAPLLFLIFHAYLMLNLRLMVDNVCRYNEMLHNAKLEPKQADDFRLLLTNFPFVQLLAGTTQTRRSFLGWLLMVIVWITVVLAPVILLLLMQLQFLPYHDWRVTWWHRIIIILDLGLLWCFWPSIMLAGERSRMRILVSKGAGITLTTVIVIFAVFFATFPSEALDQKLFVATVAWIPIEEPMLIDNEQGPPTANVSKSVEVTCNTKEDDTKSSTQSARESRSNWTWKSLYQVFFLGEVNELKGTRNSLWSNTLVLPDADFVEDDKLDNVDRTISLRGRDLWGAVLVRTDLRKADFTGAVLDHADLSRGRFDQASFGCAKKGSGTLEDKTQGAGCTSLLHARLNEARLRAANIQFAHLEGASLACAQLQTASLLGAHLDEATLDNAQLHGANLLKAQLRDASLDRAQLQGANLGGADLEGASLAYTIVWRADHEAIKLKHCNIGTLIHSRSYIDDRGQVVDLDAAKVVDNATKNASPVLTQKIAAGLKFLSEDASEKDARDAQSWTPQEEEQPSSPVPVQRPEHQ